eukprot:TRINITY_DN408_c0_g1_i1.p1 TRINITY_DN408_c0_g1~~TRINITY_DN408_c0_g1_i1.p1  ORF type:complete len:699 (+),score=255.44 TRINITY_DN408_c0_g1_i1:118-2214(+)
MDTQSLAERENDSLRTDLKSKMVELDRLKLTVESTRRTIEEVRRENDSLRVEVVEKEQILDERNALLKKVENLENEKIHMESQLQRTKHSLQKMKEKIERTDELEKNLVKCHEEETRLTQRVEELTVMEERLRREIEILKNESKRISEEKTVEVAQLRDLVEEQRIGYESKRASYEETLRKERVVSERYKKNLIDCEERISSLENSLTEVSLELAQSNDQANQYKREHDQSKKQVDEVEKEVAQYKIELGRERQKTHSLHMQMTRLRTELSSCRKSLDDQEEKDDIVMDDHASGCFVEENRASGSAVESKVLEEQESNVEDVSVGDDPLGTQKTADVVSLNGEEDEETVLAKTTMDEDEGNDDHPDSIDANQPSSDHDHQHDCEGERIDGRMEDKMEEQQTSSSFVSPALKRHLSPRDIITPGNSLKSSISLDTPHAIAIDLDTSNPDVDALHKEHSSLVAQYQSMVRTLRVRLRDEVPRRKHLESSVHDMQSEVKRLRQEVVSLGQDNRRLKSTLQRREESISVLRKECLKMTEEFEAMTEILAEMERHHQSIVDDKDDLISTFRLELEVADRELRESKKRLEHQEGQIDKLSQSCDQFKKACEEYQVAIEEKSKRVKSLFGDNLRMKAHISSLDEALLSMKGENDVYRNEIERLASLHVKDVEKLRIELEKEEKGEKEEEKEAQDDESVVSVVACE